MFRGTDGCHVVGLHGIASVENSGKPHSRYGMVGGNPAIPYKTPIKSKEMIKMAGNISKIEGKDLGMPYTFHGDAYVEVMANGQTYTMSMATIMQMFKHFRFDAVEKRVHTHLENPELIR